MRSSNIVYKMCCIDDFIKKHLYRMKFSHTRWKHNARLQILISINTERATLAISFLSFNLHVVITNLFDRNRH